MQDECLVCGAPLEYLEQDITMECAFCHKKEDSKTHCVNGHYVCNECHTKGIGRIVSLCLNSDSRNPFEIFLKLVSLPFCHLHGPEHHILVGASLLTAYRNAGGNIDLIAALSEMQSRGKRVPGGACGFWGACGAGISTGMFISIITDCTPLSGKNWGLSNLMTARALRRIGEVGGPRCCKRNSFLAISEAIEFIREYFDIELEKTEIYCRFSSQNNQCLNSRCPFYLKVSE